jgi:hypothetical protein
MRGLLVEQNELLTKAIRRAARAVVPRIQWDHVRDPADARRFITPDLSCLITQHRFRKNTMTGLDVLSLARKQHMRGTLVMIVGRSLDKTSRVATERLNAIVIPAPIDIAAVARAILDSTTPQRERHATAVRAIAANPPPYDTCKEIPLDIFERVHERTNSLSQTARILKMSRQRAQQVLKQCMARRG